MNPTDSARFWIKVTIAGPDECWTWTGALTGGYGRFWWNGRTGMAHRFVWENTHGPLPGGRAHPLDHLCRNRACVNPTHLEPVTLAENVLRGVGLSAENARKTHCKRGHPFDDQNTYVTAGTRKCKTCAVARTRAWRKQNRPAEENAA